MKSSAAADRPVDHVAIAVPSIDEASSLFELLTGERCSRPQTLERDGVRVAFVGPLELVEPLGPDTPVARFLERRGTAVHHIALRSSDIAADLVALREAGLRPIDETPRAGAHGHLVAFLHPATTGGILIELVQGDEGPDSAP